MDKAEQQSTASPARRGQDRRVVLKGAKIVFDGGKAVMVCRVRDVSPGGARLEFPPHQTMPEKFELHVAGSPVRRCELRWTRNNIVGVRFLDEKD